MDGYGKYVLPTLFGLIAGVAMAFGNLALDTAKRVAVCEERYLTILHKLETIEAAVNNQKKPQ